jgi:hypothetical protein
MDHLSDNEVRAQIKSLILKLAASNIRAVAAIHDERKITVVCSASPGSDGDTIPRPCDGCGQQIWLGPDVQELLEKRGARPSDVLCVPCFFKNMKERRDAVPED